MEKCMVANLSHVVYSRSKCETYLRVFAFSHFRRESVTNLGEDTTKIWCFHLYLSCLHFRICVFVLLIRIFVLRVLPVNGIGMADMKMFLFIRNR